MLREHRVRIGISQEELAFRGEFDRTFPSLLERGKRTPTITVFGITPAALIAETARRVRAMEANSGEC
jgi:transcriptional regulator with XRE-family HTH domain